MRERKRKGEKGGGVLPKKESVCRKVVEGRPCVVDGVVRTEQLRPARDEGMVVAAQRADLP